MEQNQFDLMEEPEQDLVYEGKPTPELKEYEKLLIAERNRKDYEKAVSLVKAGCLKQTEVKGAYDFSKLEKIETKKKYKGIYTLYRNVETMQLYFICPLVENNKGDDSAKQDIKPYGYDVVELELMDDKTYQEVIKAANNTLHPVARNLYVTSWILYVLEIVVFVLLFFYALIVSIDGGAKGQAFFQALNYAEGPLAGIVISTPILVLAKIKYDKYKNQ
jgi:hypothetical protein